MQVSFEGQKRDSGEDTESNAVVEHIQVMLYVYFSL